MRLAFVLSFLTGAYSVSVWGPEKVISHTKGNVTVQCKYDKSYTNSVKYWCKVNTLLPCSKLVSTSEDTHSRITIRDNKTEGAFYITMTDLTKDDKGQYDCGIERSFALDEQALVHVQVNEDDTRPDLHEPVSVTGMASSSKTTTVDSKMTTTSTAQVEPIPASTAEKENGISKQKQEGSTYHLDRQSLHADVTRGSQANSTAVMALQLLQASHGKLPQNLLQVPQMLRVAPACDEYIVQIYQHMWQALEKSLHCSLKNSRGGEYPKSKMIVTVT
ncbi:CMRF35-like molecule 5 isoform X1 [Conger conger]|uniref:CMRF35-like molecule 5 isoform X1 n=1 Tax=Conger conger TaxID=82655 RepID=UPI002A59CEEC|nr:CMRF35-like molecule 5 isoform X1 [Conger conger]